MKQTISLVAIVALGVLTGCTSSKMTYRSSATLTPAPDAGQFDVAFVIEDMSDPAKPNVVGSPRLRILKGKEGSVSVGDETSGITCTALVVDASGKPEARTTVSVRKDGEDVWSEKQTVTMSE
jgi:hypothetical protein